ncbi:unnamed protein product [Fusarium graminearum]|nr:hypothetical protein HG531_012902 [Fusarium graminearum]CAG1959857.1 unnamed protein product [Fusarium graminearum]
MTKRRNPPPCGPGLCHLPEKISQKTGRVGVGYYYSPSMYFASWKLKPIPGHRTPNIGPAGKDFAEIGGAGARSTDRKISQKDICVGAGREYLTMDRRGVCYTAVNRWGVEKKMRWVGWAGLKLGLVVTTKISGTGHFAKKISQKCGAAPSTEKSSQKDRMGGGRRLKMTSIYGIWNGNEIWQA